MTNIKEIFDTEIKDKLLPLEKKRKSIIFNNYILSFSIFMIVWLISLIIPELHKYSSTLFISGLVMSIFFNFTIHNLSPSQEQYHKAVKNILINAFIKKYHDRFEYKQDKYIAPLKFLSSGFSTEKFYKSTGSDLIVLNYNNHFAQFSFFTTFKRGRTKSMRIPNSGRPIEVIFRGFLLIVDIPENNYNERFDLIEKMKQRNWKYKEDANSVYFCKESDISFFKTSVFSSTQNYLNFAESLNILQQVIDNKQL